MADFAIREDRKKIKKLKAENRKLKIALMMKDKEKTVEVTDDQRVLAVETILQEANSNVDKAFPDAEDEPTRDLLHSFWDHWNENKNYFKNGGQKSSGIRFPELVMQFSILVLAKSSHSLYNMLSQLPSLSYVSSNNFHCVALYFFLNLHSP